MPSEILIKPIGSVSSPIQSVVDDVWGGVISRITLDGTRFTPESLTGLDEFSHVEVIFQLDQVAESSVEHGTRHPRGRTEWPRIGIFAQRAKARPNRLGVTVCRLLSVSGLAIEVEGLDAIQGTPVLDLKPYLEEFGPKGPVRQPAWSRELMAGYWNTAE